MKFYAFARKAVKGFFNFIYNIHIVGRENEPKDAPFIVCSNHISNADVIVLGLGIEHQLRYMAKAELFKVPLLRRLIKILGAFPINRGEADVGALKTCLKLLSDGEVVSIFPQGKRFPKVDVRDTEPKAGVGMIAYRSGVPVLPVYLETKKNKHLIFRRNTVHIGEPIMPEEFAFEGGNKSEYERAAGLIFSRIIELAPERKDK
ncbi:MAG: 1-acyl-sn-glycerol-3-phosphate acyltransferase [Clostridia bacterium]|nr:1-acyl-sn-glycerol-3-phosphate acyltransferase [Clostridia bacterium]